MALAVINLGYRDQAIGKTCEYFTCSSAKLDSIDEMPSIRVSFCLRKRS